MATTVTSNTGQVYNVADIINQVNARYAQGKTPDLVVKSALQLGLPEDFIMTLPGVDQAAFTTGANLISSGAFAPTATGTAADIAAAAPVGSAMYNARLAQGLDPFGFPAEEVAKLTAAGLYGAGRQYDPTGGQTLSQGQQYDVLAQKAREAKNYQINMGIGYSPLEEPAYFEQNGIQFQVRPDGSFFTVRDTGPNSSITYNFSPSGEYLGEDTYQGSGRSAPLQRAVIGALGGFALGPAGLGLSVPTAAAAGAGGATLFTGGSVEDALKAAALSGATAYGAQSLFGTLGTESGANLVAQDAAQLAQQGLSADQIQTVLQQSYGISPGTAGAIAFEASSGAPVSRLAQDFSNITLGTQQAGTSTPTVVTPSTVTVTAPAVAGTSATIPAAVGGLLTGAVTSPTTTTPGTVTVTGQPTSTTLGEQLGGAAGGLLQLPSTPGGTSQRVEVTGEKETVPGISTLPNTAGSVTSAGTVNITGQRIPAPADEYISPVIPALINPVIPTAPTTAGPATTKPSIFTPSDVLRLLGLAGVTAAGSQAGTGTGTGTVVTPRSDANIGSTTPQFGDEYYSAVQRYYNTFMPQTPRDVAGPLQQWYENRYGAPVGAAPTTPTMISPGAGTGAVSGGMAPPSSAGTGMMASAAMAPMGAQTVEDFMAAPRMAAPSTSIASGSRLASQVISEAISLSKNPYTFLDTLSGALQTVQARDYNRTNEILPGGKYGNTRTNTLDYITSNLAGDANDLIIESQIRARKTKEPLNDAIINVVYNNPTKYTGFSRAFDLLNERITPEEARAVNTYDQYAKFVKQYSDIVNGLSRDTNLIKRDLAAELSKPAGKPEFVPGYGWTSNVSDFQQPDVIKSLQDRLAFTQDLIEKRSSTVKEFFDKINKEYDSIKDLNLSFKVGDPRSYLGDENSYAASIIGTPGG